MSEKSPFVELAPRTPVPYQRVATEPMDARRITWVKGPTREVINDDLLAESAIGLIEQDASKYDRILRYREPAPQSRREARLIALLGGDSPNAVHVRFAHSRKVFEYRNGRLIYPRPGTFRKRRHRRTAGK